MPIDPVCKMHVDIAEAAASYDYHSEAFYFCSLGCLREFEKDPDKYVHNMTDEERIAG